jgi:CheY-like chemotaxis protein
MRVLIVDDDPNCRQIVELMLARLGWTLFVAENGAEAVKLAASVQPDLVLMDILMPQLSGLDAVAQMKALPGLDERPVLAITALAFESERQEALRAGFDHVITKPFSRRQLLEGIAKFVPGINENNGTKVPA